MHDTLRFIEHDPIHRAYHHDDMTFGLLYAFSERFILPISHDEVVHGKGSLIAKMPGDRWQKFANLRAYLGFMWSHPGKKLLFMGCEIAQEREWNHDTELDWFLLDDPAHAGIQRLVRDLNRTLSRRAVAASCATASRRAFAGSSATTAPTRCSPICASARNGNAPILVDVQHDAGAATQLSHRRAAQGTLARDLQHRFALLRRHRPRQRRRRERRRRAGARRAAVGRADASAARDRDAAKREG